MYPREHSGQRITAGDEEVVGGKRHRQVREVGVAAVGLDVKNRAHRFAGLDRRGAMRCPAWLAGGTGRGCRPCGPALAALEGSLIGLAFRISQSNDGVGWPMTCDEHVANCNNSYTSRYLDCTNPLWAPDVCSSFSWISVPIEPNKDIPSPNRTGI